MKKIELIYDKSCPNVTEARSALLKALNQVGMPSIWTEWDREDPKSPEYVKSYGSPTILVEGRDITGESTTAGANCCRIYTDKTGKFRGVPDLEILISGLKTGS